MDYRFRDWFGVRGGKVKTVVGLYNDTQDMEFLHPWALLPQSAYPTDLRSVNIAHTGGDVYGRIGLSRFGSVSYVGYGGAQPVDTKSGFIYGVVDQGFSKVSYSGMNGGYDVRWSTPIPGLRGGLSYLRTETTVTATFKIYPASAEMHSRRKAVYAEQRWHGLTLASEYHWEPRVTDIAVAGRSQPVRNVQNTAFYVSAAYRVKKWFQVGTYHSRYKFEATAVPGLLPASNSYINDQTVTTRFDFLRHWTCKVEGHFMDGVGSSLGAHGFYVSDNPQGLKQRTNLLVLRLGINL